MDDAETMSGTYRRFIIFKMALASDALTSVYCFDVRYLLLHTEDAHRWLHRCMGHNRGWEEAASQLCGVAVELKTANAALLEAHGGSWKEVSNYYTKLLI